VSMWCLGEIDIERVARPQTRSQSHSRLCTRSGTTKIERTCARVPPWRPPSLNTRADPRERAECHPSEHKIAERDFEEEPQKPTLRMGWKGRWNSRCWCWYW
jgi:hypothetical protein